ncbi:hypothetical protein [Amycolatopsis acidicola]|nr:hypothetical protein [Amycolatopsis acidicola]
MRVEPSQLYLIVVGTAACAIATATAGPIAFVALTAARETAHRRARRG